MRPETQVPSPDFRAPKKMAFVFRGNEVVTQATYALLSICVPEGRGRMLRYLAIKFFGVSKFGRHADCLVGAATVIDGDTIIVAGESVRLHGIDAPEMDQTFWWRSKQIACGTMAFAALEALTAGVRLRCEPVERDLHGRLVAKCFSPNGVDVGRRLVSSGWALAYRQYSTDYVKAEEEARKAKRGMWRGTFAKPWEWRALQRRGRANSPNEYQRNNWKLISGMETSK